jgi:hypothetical protein
MDVIGIHIHVPLQLEEVISACCSGPGKMDVIGMNVHVPLQLKEVI